MGVLTGFKDPEHRGRSGANEEGALRMAWRPCRVLALFPSDDSKRFCPAPRAAAVAPRSGRKDLRVHLSGYSWAQISVV